MKTLGSVQITSLDHLVLNVADVDATVDFYERLSMRRETFGYRRVALRFGRQKINLHQQGAEIAPHAACPTPGSGDVCLLVVEPPEEIAEQLRGTGVEIELGPANRTGAMSSITSLYVRDPDGNLVELSRPR